MKKMIAMTLAATLAFGSMGVTAYGSVFADINQVPWPGAATFIDEAASLGLMVGYNEDCKKYCKPRNNVTYCETMQLAYSIMKVHNKQSVSDTIVAKWKPVISAYNIPAWAYEAVSYGLENEVLKPEDLNEFRNGTLNATREDVAIIFGKALATIDGYKVNANPVLNYKDTAQASAEAKPYMELLNKENLMVGDPDNNFNPKAKINRSEMAVLSVKMYKKMAGAAKPVDPKPQLPAQGTASGTVADVMVLTNGDIFLSIKTSASTGLNLFGDKNKVTPTYQGQKVTFGDIGDGDTVKVSYEGDELKSVEIVKSVKGINKTETYELVDLTSSKITVKSGSKEKSYYIARNAEVVVDGSRSDVSKLQSAMRDMKYNVTLTFDKYGDVSKINAVKNANNPTTGLVTYLNEDSISIKAGSREYDYKLADDLTVKQGSKIVPFSKLRESYRDNNITVTLKLNSRGEVTEINIGYMEDETHGALTYLNRYRIEILANGRVYKYELDDNVYVTIDGKRASVSELNEKFDDSTEFNVALDVDRYDYVREIAATTKNAANSAGELKKISSSDITVRVGSKDITYKLDRDVDVRINGKSKDLSDLKDNYKDNTFEVELKFDRDNKVTEIRAELKRASKGMLKDIDERNETIRVTTAGIDVEVQLDEDAKITLDGKTISLRSLNRELDDVTSKEKIYVELSYNSRKEVSSLKASWEGTGSYDVQGLVSKINNDEIEVKVGSSRKTYPIASGNLNITLDGRETFLNRVMDEFDRLDRDEVMKVSLDLNSKKEVTGMKAEVMYLEELDEDLPAQGELVNVGRDDITIEVGRSEYTYTVDADAKFYYSLSTRVDDRDYEKSYDKDLLGLDDFLYDCDRAGDTCNVTLSFSNGNVTKVRAIAE